MKMQIQEIVRSDVRNIGGYIHGTEYVICPACKNEVGLNVSYFDEYADDGAAQVHYECLSPERRKEIELL